MRQIGVVVENHGDRVKVKIARTSACEHCGQCTGAERQLRTVLTPQKEIVVEAFNEAQAVEGQVVELLAPGSTVLLAALWAYLIPGFAFLAGAAAGHWLGPVIGISQSGASMSLAILSLGGGYGLLWWKNKGLNKDKRFISTVDKVLS